MEAKYGGQKCPDNLVETKSCFKKCPSSKEKHIDKYCLQEIFKLYGNIQGSNENDCVVSQWSAWSECKQGKSCTEGYQDRERHVIRVAIGDGKDCPKLKERRMCYLGPEACKSRS